MTQYNSVNVNLSNSQLNKLKSAIKNETEVILRLSSIMTGNSNGEVNFPRKLSLTKRQVQKLLSSTDLSKIIQLGRFLGKLLRLLLKVFSCH